MQVQLLVERGQDVCTVNLAGKAYVFKRNEVGALVTDITDKPTIDWVSDPRNPSFMPYVLPEKIEKETDNTGNSELGKIGKIEEKVSSPWSTGETVVETVVTSETSGTDKQTAKEPDPDWPPLLKKGAKQTSKARE